MSLLARSSRLLNRSASRNAFARSFVARFSTAAPSADAAGTDSTYESVQNYYGKVLTSTKDLKTNACTASSAPPLPIRQALARVPREITDRFYGCGTALPLGIEGLDVLDLGSGSGQDCYIASSLVGETGSVTGIDMTEEQLNVARSSIDDYCQKTLGYSQSNLEFKQGYIEFIKDAGVPDASKNLVVSNCVVNLSPDKKKVIQGVYNALREGGEFFFSDVYANRRLTQEARQHEVLWGECLSGALYTEDFRRICAEVGFLDPRAVETAPITVTDPTLLKVLAGAEFYSITYRLFKLPGKLEDVGEDYGQVATYLGTLTGSDTHYQLDDQNTFEAFRPKLVCGNTASILSDSWLSKHFRVDGDRSRHFGRFYPSGVATSNTGAAASEPAACGPSDDSSSSGGGCC